MPEFVDVMSTADLPVGRARAVVVQDRTIAVYHTKSGFYATDNNCPHRGGPLAEGDLIGEEITCPWHLWGFDVATGECAGNREISVTAYETRVEGDRVMVKLS